MKLSQITIALTASLSMSVFAHDIGHEHEHVDGGWNSKAGFVSDVDYQANLFNTRGKDEETIIKRSIWLAEKYDLKRTPEQVARANKARRKYEKAIAINSILPSSVGIIGNTHDNFTKAVKRNQDAGITLASATVYAFPGSLDEGITAYDVIAASDEVVAEQNMKKVDTVDDI
ncbi:hypothetical protein [Vibrio crassostreae]|nr:hypothetical protein [Vibrio crassostreae]